jgi:hypothetical protein
MTERAMKIPGAMMGQETLDVTKMLITYVTVFLFFLAFDVSLESQRGTRKLACACLRNREICYTQDEEIVRAYSELMDKNDLNWGYLCVTGDEKQRTVEQYMSYLPGWT